MNYCVLLNLYFETPKIMPPKILANRGFQKLSKFTKDQGPWVIRKFAELKFVLQWKQDVLYCITIRKQPQKDYLILSFYKTKIIILLQQPQDPR